MKQIFIITFTILALTSCATIISGSTQTVIFAAESGTKIFNSGVLIAEIPEGQNQLAVIMKRRLSNQYMTARKTGYQDTNFSLKSSVNGVVFVNILLGGLVGIAIDCATGAAAKYPASMQIYMQPLNGTQSDNIQSVDDQQSDTQLPNAQPLDKTEDINLNMEI